MTSTLPAPPDLNFERRSHVARSVTLGIFTILVISGFTGLLGVAKATKTGRSANGMEVQVTYARRARPGLAVPFSVKIANPGGFEAPIDVTTTISYLASFDENGLNPEPDSVTTDAETITWTFDPPKGDTFTVWFDARIEPGVQWKRHGTTTVTSGSEEVTVHYTSWILP